MSATLDQSSRPWWSMKASSAPAPECVSEKPKLKSKTLNSLFGRKYKKQTPSLAIPDPPLPIQNIPPEHTQSFTNRPPSKSVSSTRSRPDSLEPRTPSDVHHNPHHRHSLLTLSDTDPFASPRNVSIVSSPHLPTDPTRLSAYSNTSSGAGDQSYAKSSHEQPRASFASSSYSQNHAYGPESPIPPVLSPALPPTRKLLHKRSDTALNSNRGQRPSPHISITGTSGALGPTAVSSRPLTRPRGLTDNGTLQKSGFFVDSLNFATPPGSITAVASEPPSSARPPSSRRPSNASSTRSPVIASPRVVIRQASVQGLSKPAPPPSQRLPSPPQPRTEASDFGRGIIPHPPPPRRLHSNSNASSTVSFASCLDPDAFPTDAFPSPPILSSPGRPRRISDRSRPFNSSTTDADKVQSAERSQGSLTPHTPPTLKKAVSHQSLLKRGPLFSASSSTQTLASPPNREQDKDKEKEKTPHKLRIFPHPRIPMPPIPLKHSSSSTSTLIEPTPQEQKRVSAGSVRKRLFSGSSLRRPSTSHSVKDEDSQSVFSFKSEQDLYINTSFFKPWISTQSSGPSHWEEASPDTAPNSPTHGALASDGFANVEPMSPILGRYEPVRTAPPLTFSSPTLTGARRQRGFSMRSSNTVASIERDDESILSGLSPRSLSNGQRFHRSNTFTAAPRPRAGSNISQNGKAESVLSVHSVSTRPRTATSSSVPRKLSDRPSTAQPSLHTGPQLSSAAAVERAFSYAKPSESPPAFVTSLPPPPRRNRPRPVIAPQIEEPTQAQTQPLPPKSPATSPLASPIIPSPSPSGVQIAGPTPPPTVISLQPPPRRAPRPKISFEKIIHRRSIMKKPSFLDFDDGDDGNELGGDMDVLGVGQKDDLVELFDEPRSRVPSMRSERSSSRPTSSRAPSSRTNSTRNSRGLPDLKSPPTASESFLDLARESFDATRGHF